MEYNFISAEAVRDRNAVIEILREKEHYYKNLLDILPIAIYSCDANGYITFYNKASVELWGREAQIGRDRWCGAWKIYTAGGERMLPESCPMAIALKEGRIISGTELIIERQDGNRQHVLPHTQPLLDSDGNTTGTLNLLFSSSNN